MAKAKKTENIYYGTGKRKASIAKVRLVSGSGKITINGRDVHEYLPCETLIMNLSQPLELTNTKDLFDVEVEVSGGGFSGQTGAIRLGIARALILFDADADQARDDAYRKVLKVNGFVTRDSRKKERKKPGLKKARRAPQFSKR